MPEFPASPEALHSLFGRIDIYLFDQLLRGNLRPPMRVLDAGCGDGRNLVYLLRAGFDVSAIDIDPRSIDAVRDLARSLAPTLPADNFTVASIDALPHPDASFDAVISNAVLHFARDRAMLEQAIAEIGRVLRKGGILFARLASSIGIEDRIQPRGDGWHLLPDGSQRLLVSEADLLGFTRQLRGQLLDPIKTTNVQGLRCMTTWVVRRDR